MSSIFLINILLSLQLAVCYHYLICMSRHIDRQLRYNICEKKVSLWFCLIKAWRQSKNKSVFYLIKTISTKIKRELKKRSLRQLFKFVFIACGSITFAWLQQRLFGWANWIENWYKKRIEIAKSVQSPTCCQETR